MCHLRVACHFVNFLKTCTNFRLRFVRHSIPYRALHNILPCSKLANSMESEQSLARRCKKDPEYSVNVSKSIVLYFIQRVRRGH